MSKEISPAFLADTLFSKSKVYILRGLKAKSEGSLEEYQLWASLALELLGKSSLSTVSPALVADPTHYQSLFAACGHPLSTDVKTITAKTLFERLSHISKSFDKRIQNFCVQLSLRRNSELHSGELPFSAMTLKAWEAQFWHAAHIILEIQELELEKWLDKEGVEATRQLLSETKEAIKMMVITKISHALEDFEKANASKSKRDKLIEASKKANLWGHYDMFDYVVDDYILDECPSCEGMGVLGGIKYDEFILDTPPRGMHIEFDIPTEYVEVTYVVEEFICLVCKLHLRGTQEILAASLQDEFIEVEERELEFEPDYGNE